MTFNLSRKVELALEKRPISARLYVAEEVLPDRGRRIAPGDLALRLIVLKHLARGVELDRAEGQLVDFGGRLALQDIVDVALAEADYIESHLHHHSTFEGSGAPAASQAVTIQGEREKP